MTETINVLGLELPVIAKLSHGFTLASHRNGPCICTETTIFTLTYWMIEGFEDDELPRDVAQAAIDAYVAYSWPLIQQVDRTAAGYEVLLANYQNALAIIRDNLHERKCFDCGNVAWHAAKVAPYMNCKKCGSQDTRWVRKPME